MQHEKKKNQKEMLAKVSLSRTRKVERPEEEFAVTGLFSLLIMCSTSSDRLQM